MEFVDDFLNNITMYRLVLYFLIVLSVVGLLFSVFGILPFDPISFVFSFTFILTVSFIANYVFAKTFEAPTNVESVYISALILGLVITPPKNFHDVIFLGWATTLAMASKFIFALGRKHLFNPVAISILLTYFFINKTASWWVGTTALMPLVFVGGFLIIRKIKRWDLVWGFLVSSILTTVLYGFINKGNVFGLVWRSVTDTPLLFFAAIMITEPLTTPPTKLLRVVYGVITGILFSPQFNLMGFYTTPEMALILGNIFSYIVSPKYKLFLSLKEKLQLTPDTYDFVFTLDKPIKFTPGQYMEFTFDHPSPDDRGNRRYLSLANSPTEQEIRLGIKFGNPPSSFKKNLLNLNPNQKIVASQLIGDFTLPKDPAQKLVLIAGGIGITPFRSMIKYLIDTRTKRDIIIIYTASGADQFAYKAIFEQAQNRLGIRTIFVDTKVEGHMDAIKLSKEVPDYQFRTFYVSGSHGVVSAFESVLKNLGIPKNKVVTDYFPGFA